MSESSRPPKIPVSVLVVIHTADLQVLLLERADRSGYWQSVTGSLDAWSEPPLQAAVREVEEETGIVIGAGGLSEAVLSDWDRQVVYEIYPQWRHRYAPGVTQNTEHVFSLQVPAGTSVRLAPREHLRCEWLPWAEAARRCFSPSNAAAITELAQRKRETTP